MIVFELQCLNGHIFEGWFDDKSDLENQIEEGILQCPVCESTSVTQKIHPIAIKKSASYTPDYSNNSYSQSPDSERDRQAFEARQEAMAELTGKMLHYIEKNFEDVGSSFAEKALKIHYGASKHKNIRGTTTKEEEKTLQKEGVPIMKIPFFKKDDDNLN